MRTRTISAAPIAELVARRDELVLRLKEGDRQIAIARANGTDFARLETHWIKLLRDYESVVTRIAATPADSYQAAA